MNIEHNGLRYPTHKLPDVLDDGEPVRLQGLWKLKGKANLAVVNDIVHAFKAKAGL